MMSSLIGMLHLSILLSGFVHSLVSLIFCFYLVTSKFQHAFTKVTSSAPNLRLQWVYGKL
jgi:hypothetical protein